MRATDDIVADLREHGRKIGYAYSTVTHNIMRDAADRLAELDAQLAAVNAALDQYARDLRYAIIPKEYAAMACVSAVAKAVVR